jgi:hypothetical protein
MGTTLLFRGEFLPAQPYFEQGIALSMMSSTIAR